MNHEIRCLKAQMAMGVAVAKAKSANRGLFTDASELQKAKAQVSTKAADLCRAEKEFSDSIENRRVKREYGPLFAWESFDEKQESLFG